MFTLRKWQIIGLIAVVLVAVAVAGFGLRRTMGPVVDLEQIRLEEVVNLRLHGFPLPPHNDLPLPTETFRREDQARYAVAYKIARYLSEQAGMETGDEKANDNRANVFVSCFGTPEAQAYAKRFKPNGHCGILQRAMLLTL